MRQSTLSRKTAETAITLTRYMLKLMIDSKISTNANAYGANGYMLMDKRPGQKEDTANA